MKQTHIGNTTKSMKRMVTLLLVVVMIVAGSGISMAKTNGNAGKGNSVAALASKGKAVGQVKNEAKAYALYELGLFKGVSTTEFNPALEVGATRAHAIVTIGQALKWEQEPTFGKSKIAVPKDVAQKASWAAPYVQYALERGITNGIGRGNFGADVPVNARMIYTWYARALMYEDDVWGSPELLVKIGLLTQSQFKELDLLSPATRDHLVGIMYSSLNWRYRGSTTKLVQHLLKMMWLDYKAAVRAGLLDPEEKVMTFSLKQLSEQSLQLTFRHELDEVAAGSDGNYLVKIQPLNGVERTLSTAEYDMIADGKLVYLSFADRLSVGTTVSVSPATAVVSRIEKLTTAENSTKTIIIHEDNTSPSIMSVTAISPIQLRFVFSEPIVNSLGAYPANPDSVRGLIQLTKVGDTEPTLHADADFAYSKANTVLTMTLNDSKPLAHGQWRVDVAPGLKDQDDPANLSSVFNTRFMIDTDKDAPVVSMVSVQDQDTLAITFNEPVTPGIGEFHLGKEPTFTRYAMPAAGAFNGSKTVVMLDLIEAQYMSELVSGTTFVLKYNGLQDLNGNVQTQQKQISFVVPGFDKEAPYAKSSEINNVTGTGSFRIEVVFSEEVDGFTTADFTLKKEKPDTDPIVTETVDVSEADVGYDASKKMAVILLDADDLHEGLNKLTLSLLDSISDLSWNRNKLVPQDLQLTFTKDTTEPEADSVVLAWVPTAVDEGEQNRLVLTITFSEKIEAFTTDDFSLTTAGENEADPAVNVDATFGIDDAKKVVIITITEPGDFAAGDVLTLTLRETITDASYNKNVLKDAPVVKDLTVP